MLKKDVTLDHSHVISFALVRGFMRPNNALVGTKLSRITDAVLAEQKRVVEAYDTAGKKYADVPDAETRDADAPAPEQKPIVQEKDGKTLQWLATGTPVYQMTAENKAKYDAEIKDLLDGKCTISVPTLTEKDLANVEVVGGDIGDALDAFIDEG